MPNKPTNEIGNDAKMPSQMPCAPANEAPGIFCSPTRRATVAVTAIARPIEIVKTSVNNDSVNPTMAMASVLLEPTREM